MMSRQTKKVLVTLSMAFIAMCAPLKADVALVLESAEPAIHVKAADRTPLLAIARMQDRLVAVGTHGTIVISDDSGQSWRQVDAPVNVDLTAVTFSGSKTGWIGGHQGVVLVSADDGETWTQKLNGAEAAQTILAHARTTTPPPGEDAERNIRRAQGLVDDGPDKPFLAIMPQPDGRSAIFFGAYNLNLKTPDRGGTWLSWSDQFHNDGELHSYAAAKVGDGWYVVGERGMIRHTSDNGETFEIMPSPYDGSFFGVLAADENRVLLFGLKGHVFVSADRGVNWQKPETHVDVSFSTGTVLSDKRIVLATSTGLLVVSADAGQSFRCLPEKISNSVSSITQAPDGSLVAVGLQGIARLPLASIATEQTKQGGSDQ